MQVIAMLNQKGGTGKSTLAINLASALHHQGRRVVLVDADTGATVRDWAQSRPESGVDLPPVLAADRPEMLAASVKAIAADIVIIDTPGNDKSISAKAIGIANIALIVIQPSAPDIWRASESVQQVNAKRDLGGEIHAAFVVNRVVGMAKLSKETLQGDWNEYGIPMLETSVSNSTQFAQTIANGVSIFESTYSKGKAEIQFLIEEMEKKSWL